MNMPPEEPLGADIDPPSPPSDARGGFSRRAFTGSAVLAAGVSLVGAQTTQAAARGRTRVTGFGSVSTAPHLPPGFTKTFRSRMVTAGGLRQHVVIGGEGPPLLLVHGWPENWYAWRLVMPALARHFTVIAVDQRGIGLTEKPSTGYDSATLANDLAALMTALGHQRFAVVGHDTGLLISYALAADHGPRVARLAVAEVPGPPTFDHSPPLFIDAANNNKLWHIAFNRVDDPLTEQLIRGREEIFFGYEFRIQGGKSLPDHALNYYYDLFSDPEVLRGGMGLYRAWDATLEQNKARALTDLTMPVLGIGGADSYAGMVGAAMKELATDATTVVLPSAGHWVAEQAPRELLAALTEFLAPYRAAAKTR
ncbi:alpha/beta hydrolase [Kribbella sancticallisti]|uniref:Alpha/beta hydrolase n=1 Tax=Kribbella sancticallisti TaxID=460087 RepID=A0ABN2DIZ8_9ACTN